MMAKKTDKQPKEEMSLYDRICDYTVLEEEERDGYQYAKIRTHSGAIVTMKIPHHTEEEKRELRKNLAFSMFRMCYPDKDISNYSKIQVVW